MKCGQYQREADDSPSHQVTRRPYFSNADVVRETDGRDVVRECVEPYIHDVLRIVRHGNAPLERRPADAQVPETGLDERDDLVPSYLRCHEVGLLLIQLEQFLLKCRKLEEVALLAHTVDRPAAIRTPPVHELSFGNERFVDGAVPALVGCLVEETTVTNTAPNRLRGVDVARFGRAYEVVVRNVQVLKQGLNDAEMASVCLRVMPWPSCRSTSARARPCPLERTRHRRAGAAFAHSIHPERMCMRTRCGYALTNRSVGEIEACPSVLS